MLGATKANVLKQTSEKTVDFLVNFKISFLENSF